VNVASMNHNPYTPPSSNIEVADAKRGSAIKAVLLGLAADIGGTIVFGGLAAAAYGVYLGATGSMTDGATMDRFSYDSPLGIVMTSVGCLFSVLGGYVCARVARHSEYRLGGIMCAVSVLLVVLTSDEEARPIVTAALTLATVVAIMGGVHLGVRKTRAGR
jgi:hypothetical protein